jgi:hypothetical protein
LPEFPLLDVAKKLGLDVVKVYGGGFYYGYYSQNRKVIGIATPEEKTFFHELCHAIEDKIFGGLVMGQEPLQEIVAEFSAQCLCRIVGKSYDKHAGNSYEYIERYAKEAKLTPYGAILRLLPRVDNIFKYIFGGKNGLPS